jgi:Ti type entry exclusion protein TrbK
VKLPVIIIGVAIATAAACGAGIWLWSSKSPSPRQTVVPAANDVFGAPKKYDTTGGQQMKPRWGN